MDLFPERSLEMELIFPITTLFMTPRKTNTPMQKKTTILPKKMGVFSPSSKIWVIFSHGKNLHAFSEGEKTAAPCLKPNRNLSIHRRCPRTRPTYEEGRSTKKNESNIVPNKPKKNRTEKSPTKTSKEPKLAFVLFVVGIFCSPALKFHQKHHPKLAGFCLSFSTSQG